MGNVDCQVGKGEGMTKEEARKILLDRSQSGDFETAFGNERDSTSALTREFTSLAQENDELTARINRDQERRSQVRERMQNITRRLSVVTARPKEGHNKQHDSVATGTIHFVRQFPHRIFSAAELVDMGIGTASEIHIALAFHTRQGRMERVARGRYRLAKAGT